MNTLAELRSSRELLVNLTLRDIRGKYKRTVLGQAWSLVNPVAQMLIYSVVFGFFLRNDPGPGNPSGLSVFALWLCAGLLPWLFFANMVTAGMSALVDNSNLLLKVYFPRQTLLVSNAMAWLFTHAIEMGVLVVATLLFGGRPLLYLPATIFFMLMLGAFGLGVSYVLAIANVYFRDTKHFITLFMQIWFYMSAIVYPIKLVLVHAKKYPLLVDAFKLNPIVRFGEVFRNTIYDGRWPSLVSTVYLTVVSLVTLAIGQLIFNHYADRVAEEL
ncbi:MAG TPA: ABC transporter permease [Jatrophihabitantaceae bacterium]|nr:ABC transporter permease [Jatrophihabitantaceae bacterium]